MQNTSSQRYHFRQYSPNQTILFPQRTDKGIPERHLPCGEPLLQPPRGLLRLSDGSAHEKGRCKVREDRQRIPYGDRRLQGRKMPGVPAPMGLLQTKEWKQGDGSQPPAHAVQEKSPAEADIAERADTPLQTPHRAGGLLRHCLQHQENGGKNEKTGDFAQ